MIKTSIGCCHCGHRSLHTVQRFPHGTVSNPNNHEAVIRAAPNSPCHNAPSSHIEGCDCCFRCNSCQSKFSVAVEARQFDAQSVALRKALFDAQAELHKFEAAVLRLMLKSGDKREPAHDLKAELRRQVRALAMRLEEIVR